jgi:hypothetical protein
MWSYFSVLGSNRVIAPVRPHVAGLGIDPHRVLARGVRVFSDRDDELAMEVEVNVKTEGTQPST